ncbi:MAG: helix-turn-helix domain-containing protein [Bacteroidales bacterium]|jgi:AraC family transcriptional regulator, transcriptional activator of pobA|nr:helix-turn-helix domain-containing protein [Bacteroidales bacterium]
MANENISQFYMAKAANMPGIEFMDTDFAICNTLEEVPLPKDPGRIDAAIVGLCVCGSIRLRINLDDYQISKNQIVLIMPDQIIQLGKKSKDYKGIYILASKNFINEMLPYFNQLSIFLYVKEHPVTDLSAEEVNIFKEYHSFLWKKLKMRDNAYRKEISRNLLLALLYEAYGMFSKHRLPETRKTRQEELFADFVKLVQLNFRREHSVSFYADKLCITSKYLSLLVKSVSNRSASVWIDEYVILEAKALLTSSTLTIKQISDTLGFVNQSFFGKFFRRHAGVSPRKFRGAAC